MGCPWSSSWGGKVQPWGWRGRWSEGASGDTPPEGSPPVRPQTPRPGRAAEAAPTQPLNTHCETPRTPHCKYLTWIILLHLFCSFKREMHFLQQPKVSYCLLIFKSIFHVVWIFFSPCVSRTCAEPRGESVERSQSFPDSGQSRGQPGVRPVVGVLSCLVHREHGAWRHTNGGVCTSTRTLVLSWICPVWLSYLNIAGFSLSIYSAWPKWYASMIVRITFDR